MNVYIGELIGTTLMLFLGNGVCAANGLNHSKAKGTGFLMVGLGWGFAVLLPAYMFRDISGSHFNPVVTLAMALSGKLSWDLVPGYVACQFLGAMIGSALVWIMYKPHFDATEDAATLLGTFVTGPAIRSNLFNFISEFLATFVLVYALLLFPPDAGIIGVGILITSIGISLGSTTGFALNPARDFGARIMHAVLPVKHKGASDWQYSWIPVVAPACGAVFAALLAKL